MLTSSQFEGSNIRTTPVRAIASTSGDTSATKGFESIVCAEGDYSQRRRFEMIGRSDQSQLDNPIRLDARLSIEKLWCSEEFVWNFIARR